MRLGAHRLHQGGSRLSSDPRALSNASRILTGAAPDVFKGGGGLASRCVHRQCPRRPAPAGCPWVVAAARDAARQRSSPRPAPARWETWRPKCLRSTGMAARPGTARAADATGSAAVASGSGEDARLLLSSPPLRLPFAEVSGRWIEARLAGLRLRASGLLQVLHSCMVMVAESPPR